MGLVQNIQQHVTKRLPSSPSLPTLDDLSRKADRLSPRLAFFRRRIRLKGNSSISIPLGIVLLFPCIVIILILVLFVRHPSSPGRILMPAGAPPSIRKISEKYDKVFVTGCLDPERSAADTPRANAAFVVLARNKELDGVIQSMKSIERHFNRWFNYPYVFLNDGEFNSTFKEVVQNHTKSTVEFGKIDPSMWGYPDWVDKKVAQEGIAKQGDAAIMYGGMESYHHMCRFYSGFFYKHELLQKYEWYWRLEPEIKYFCDITYDPFVHMARENKTYGFTIAVKELKETVPNIFRYASAYKRMNNLTSKGLWEMFVEKPPEEPEKTLPKDDPKYKKPLPEEILSTEPGAGSLPDIDPEAMEGEKYNMCHFWSNFEIARLDWLRSKEYNDFFEMMDRSGGFWMERWGDAPIHSLAAGALLGPSDIHYFRDFGYRHTTIQHCPANAPARQLPRKKWLEETTLDRKAREEEDAYWETWDAEKENGVGCRCKCDTDIVDVEGKQGSCLAEWVEVAGGWASP
ncbi:O-glycoside alpha-1,2-mannosyltransferase 4 [Coniosporium apollinis]|uniref:O-glycoside alpha-1,2-mannosyltransferase 4 n=2 Tax=Coniosporium TaxID=2810619 RepID=A0ABQ9NTT4_9PEZI|nr:O-glycoside alpha-1,2-mannosyltransferase 4 [Cladosporium sp. JES 115]KAJ9665308.1 O-glycoside alpha-1,2-mannosyltransferase 4 [Coniosporium apollinis]